MVVCLGGYNQLLVLLSFAVISDGVAVSAPGSVGLPVDYFQM